MIAADNMAGGADGVCRVYSVQWLKQEHGILGCFWLLLLLPLLAYLIYGGRVVVSLMGKAKNPRKKNSSVVENFGSWSFLKGVSRAKDF